MLQPLKFAEKHELSPREQALAKLRGIEVIRVDKKLKHAGGSRYVIDLFLRSSPNTTTSSMVSPASMPRSQLVLHETATPDTPLSRECMANRNPDAHADKTYLEVFAFKDELAAAAFSCQCATRCRLCQSVFEFIASVDKTPPAIVRAFSTTEMKKRDIGKLMNAFVGIVVRAQILTAATATRCEGNEKIPTLVREFLEL